MNRGEVDKAEREAFQVKGTAWVKAEWGICILYLMNKSEIRERGAQADWKRIWGPASC